MKTTHTRYLPALLALMLVTLSAAAQAPNKQEEFLGFTWSDFQNMLVIALGVAVIAFFAFFTSKGEKKSAGGTDAPKPQGPIMRKHHHQHHRVHRIRR